MIQKETTMRLDWMTEQLHMGTRAGRLPPGGRSPKTARHRSRLAKGGKRDLEKSNIKWLLCKPESRWVRKIVLLNWIA
jgi:hypothetical protein